LFNYQTPKPEASLLDLADLITPAVGFRITRGMATSLWLLPHSEDKVIKHFRHPSTPFAMEDPKFRQALQELAQNPHGVLYDLTFYDTETSEGQKEIRQDFVQGKIPYCTYQPKEIVSEI
jgi:hypothetical protein